MRGPKFCEFFQPAGLKVQSFESQHTWLWRDQRIVGQFLEKRQQVAHRHIARKQASEERLGRYLLLLAHIKKRQSSQTDPFGTKDLPGIISLPDPSA